MQAGDKMKNFAKAAKIACYVGVAAMALLAIIAVIRMGKDISKIFTIWATPLDAAGLALTIVGGVMMGLAAANFGKRQDSEGAAGDAGYTMAEYVTNLVSMGESQAGFKETTSAGYTEADGQYQTTTEQAQANADKGLQEQQQQLAKNPTNTPEDTNKTSKKQPEPETETNAA